MSRTVLVFLACATVMPWAQAQDVGRQNKSAASQDEAAIRQRLTSYLEAFNRHNAAAVGSFWSSDGVSLAEDSGGRISGRESLVRHFATFFEETPTARLSGEITEVKLVRPDVAMIDGRTTLFITDTEPVVSTYSALLVQEGGEWFISHSRERDVPPQGARTALRELEWLIGTWQDQTDAARVRTTVRWSSN
ncbi:MAG: SgcJ/EcaC family oxidoreductase [Pirellulaceae bacterium]